MDPVLNLRRWDHRPSWRLSGICIFICPTYHRCHHPRLPRCDRRERDSGLRCVRPREKMSYLLPHLHSGWAVDQAILAEEERLVIIRFGHDWDETCMQVFLSLSLSSFYRFSSSLISYYFFFLDSCCIIIDIDSFWFTLFLSTSYFSHEIRVFMGVDSWIRGFYDFIG